MHKITYALLIISFAFVTTSSCAEKIYQSEYFEISQSTFDLYNEKCIYNSPETFLESLDEQIKKIIVYLKANNWLDQYPDKKKQITLLFTSDWPCHIEGGYYAPTVRKLRIYLNHTVQLGIAPIPHEMTHLILLDYTSHTIREGLATYAQEVICNVPSIHTLGYPPHLASKQLANKIKHSNKIIDIIGTNGIPSSDITVGSLRRDYYILTYSFTKYLIDTYGIEKLLTLYNPKDLYRSYIEVYGKNLKNLKQDWISFVSKEKDISVSLEQWLENKIEEINKTVLMKNRLSNN